MTLPLSGADGNRAFRQLVRSPRPILFLDVDGTLAPLADLPENARAPAATRDLLQALRPTGASVVLVSGRAARDAHRVVGHEFDGILGSHGAELLRESRLARWLGGDPALIDDAAEAIIREMADDWPGVRLEPKGHSIALHHRLSMEEVSRLLRVVDRALEGSDIVALRGRRVIDVRSRDADKGAAVLRWLAEEEQGQIPLSDVLYAGDDTTDEDAFRALGPQAVTVAVGRRPRNARFRTPGPESLARWLRRLEQARRR
ncbi:MAG: trehalose-phosphatase [Gemmatimonadota bacterium]